VYQINSALLLPLLRLLSADEEEEEEEGLDEKSISGEGGEYEEGEKAEEGTREG
jgi:hypothetical protein